jgi:hypothetical protein
VIYFLTLKPMLGKFTAGDFIAIAGEMCRFPASNENTEWGDMFICGPVVTTEG